MLSQLARVFRSLRAHDVRYLVIGGLAVNFHGIPRSTFDLDILIQSTDTNARRLLDALEEAGLRTAREISAQDLLKNEVTIFQDYVRVDVQTATPGIDFDPAWLNKLIAIFGETEIFIVAKKDLIASKKAAGREVDLQDAKLLEMDQT